jgi:hypothetical protein
MNDLLSITARRLADRCGRGAVAYPYGGTGYVTAAIYLASRLGVEFSDALLALKGAAPYGLRHDITASLIGLCRAALDEAVASPDWCAP